MKKRACIKVMGIVQGVGFRPFVYRLATELGFPGYVLNKGAYVEIEVTGSEPEIDSFLKRLKADAPPVSSVSGITVEYFEPSPENTNKAFEIKESRNAVKLSAEVSPDIATCKDCLTELFDPGNRRFRYPFLNCTNCGPRFTVIKELPYDREKTSMACFPMCEQCQSEYSNPLNRRFHAQPNACSQCGPTLAFHPVSSAKVTAEVSFASSNIEDSLAQTCAAIREGLIVAVKGLGGFHLVCDATSSSAVKKLRERKAREAKPFAVMMTDVEQTRKYCHVSTHEENALTGLYRPIVLLRELPRDKQTNTNALADEVSKGLNTIGVMLPYTPLQHLLLKDSGRPLVMTSANRSDEPIATGNREAVRRLSTIADAFLFHDRDITARYDDTVTRLLDKSETVIRRARGYAPKALKLPFKASKPILAVGGHLKNTFCLIDGDNAYISQHVGDLDHMETLEHFNETLGAYLKLFGIQPRLIARDMHPDYGSTRIVSEWAEDKQCPFPMPEVESIVPVQHHFAHIVSCMVDNNLDEAVIGVAFDGIGYGEDGNLWGGEFLLSTLGQFKRLGKLADIRMPGGVMAIKEPWRMALSYLEQAHSTSPQTLQRFVETHGERKVQSILKLCRLQSSPLTSSCGRLFDAVGSLLGLCDEALYEGQAAILLEQEADRHSPDDEIEPYRFAIKTLKGSTSHLLEIETSAIFTDLIEDLKQRKEKCYIARRFHETIAQIVLRTCTVIREAERINKVCLSGGVFQNQILVNRLLEILCKNDFEPFIQHIVPANDGGISLGQAVAALSRLNCLERAQIEVN